jgi:hypothetical protein
MGRLKLGGFLSRCEDSEAFQASLQDAFLFLAVTGAEAPGYFRRSLRGSYVAEEKSSVSESGSESTLPHRTRERGAPGDRDSL